VGVKTPLISLYRSRNHILGKARTLVQSEHHSAEGLRDGFRQARIVISDGPFVTLGQQGKYIKIKALSTIDYGNLLSLQIVTGKKGDRQECLLKSWGVAKGSELKNIHLEESIDIPSNADYLRAEVTSDTGHHALTGALWL